MNSYCKPAILIGLFHLSIQSMFGGLVSETPSMKDYQTGAEKLTVYTDVPGHGVSVINGYASRAKSDIYEIWVRSAATDNVWVQCFANMTYNRGKEMPRMAEYQTGTSSHGYQNFTAGWTHTYANIEMSDNSPVEVEIRKIGGTKLNGQVGIVKSAVHPAHKIVPDSKKDENGRVYFKIDKPCQIVIDINGQMDDHNAAYPSSTPGGRMPDGSPVQSIAFYANPVMAKPVASPTNTIVTVNPTESSPTVRLNAPDPADYDTLVFAPGVHFTGPNFKVHPGKTYFIPGDAIIYGNIRNIDVPSAGYRCNGDRINILGYGSICSIQIPRRGFINNPEYPEWNAWDGEKDQNEGIEIENAWDTKITGVSVIDPAGFNTRFDGQSGRTNDQCLVSWVKLHSWRVNGDGFGGYSAVEDSFIRACDDSTYVRNWRRRCTWWKDSNANIFRFINFKSGGVEDCDVIYARWRDPNGVGTVFEFADGLGVQPEVTELNLKMRNIRFHDKHPNPSRLINLALTESYTGLVFENISFYVPKNGKKSRLIGSELAPWYERLVFKNITCKTSDQSQYDTGTLLTAVNFNDYFETNEYVDNILFDHPRDLTITTVSDPAEGAITKIPNQATHVETTTVTLTAVPNPNYVFSRWEGYGINASNATTNPLTIRVLDSGTVTARFSRSFNITERFTTPGTHDWVCPPGVTRVAIECRGGGGAAGSVKSTTNGGRARSGGGAGGSYARKVAVPVVPGTSYKVIVGAGGVPVSAVSVHNTALPQQTGGASKFTDSSFTVPEVVLATGGAGGNNALKSSSSANAAGGIGSAIGCIGDEVFAGGSGGTGGASGSDGAGAGGGGAGDAAPGGNAGTVSAIGLGGAEGGGNGGQGRGLVGGASTAVPVAPGGASGGVNAEAANTEFFSGPGARGEVKLTYIEGLDHFEVTTASSQTAGDPFDVTITAKDSGNATVFGSLNVLSITSPGDNLMEFDWNGDGIYGDNSGTMIDGVQIIKARSKRAQAVTLVAAVGSFTTSPACNVTIVPAAFAKLQVLVPGETSAPGTDTGKTGTPSLQGIGIAFNITVNAVDAFWNIISTVNDTVQITSSDPAALLPANAALVGGTGTFTVTQNSPGGQSITATNLTTGTQSPAISSSMTVQGFTWAGDGAANQWALNPALLNWTEPSGAPAAYTNGRFVNFNDTSTNQNVDIAGNLTPGSVTVDSSKNYMIGSTSGGSIGGSTGLTKTGSGTLTLSTANSYNGNTIVNAGSLRAGNNDAFGSSGTLTLGNTSATLELADGINISRNLTVSNTGDKKSLALRAGATSAIYSGTITNNETTVGNFEVSVGDLGSLNLSNSVGGNTLTKTGAGTLVLSGSADNAGLLLDALEGEIQLGKDQVAGVRAVAGIRRIADGATVKLTGSGTDQILGGNGTNQGVNGLEVGGTLDLNGKSESISYLFGAGYSGGVVDGALYGFTGTNTLTVGESNVSTWFPGVIQNSSGTLNLVKVGSSMLTLIGPNTYSGTTSIQNGTLTLTFGDDRLPETTTVILGSGGTSGILRLGSSNTATDPKPGTASNQTITGLATSGASTANAVVGGNATISTLTLNNSTDMTYGGKLGGSATHENKLALTKTGSGTFTLTGTRTYTGPTNVQAGTLALVGGSHASPITVASGASLDFTLGSPATSTAAVDLTTGAVKITGTVDNVSSYKLMTAASFTGPFTLSPAIPDYELQLQGAGNTELWLVSLNLATLTTEAVNGSITPSPAGGTYNLGTEITLTAVPDSGYRFSGWSGALTGSTNPATLVMDDDKSVTATFTRVFTLATSAANGSITLSPSGGTYDIGTEVTVTAVANPGYQFAGWSGDLGGAANPSTVVMDGNKSITAIFAELQITDFTTVGSHDWVCPPGVTDVTVECWGGGGAAGSAKYSTSQSTANQVRGGGGAGGSFAKTVNLPVTPGTTYKVIVGVGGLPVSVYQSTYPTPAEAVQKGGESKFTDSSLATEYVKAIGGEGGQNANKYNGTATLILNGGVGSTADCIGEVVFAGGNGGTGTGSYEGGGGGGGAGSAANGGNGGSVTAGPGGASGGGIGGAGRGVVNPTAQPNGNITNPGTAPGGGGGGAAVSKGNERFGGPGGAGKVVLSYIEGLDHFGVAAGPSQTAGVPFDVTITALDTSNAKVDGIVTTVTLTSPGGSLMEFDWNGDGTYGDHSGALVNGARTIKARNKKAETVTIIAAAHALTTPAPPGVTTAPAAFAKLQILTPGETAAPGTASGKIGTPDARTGGSAFNITANAVDEFWNLVSSGDTVGITSSDPTATLPANAPLVGGTRTFAVAFGTAGGFALTSSDITDGTKSAATSPALAVGGGSDPFTGWAGPGVTFDADTNKDGVDNGLAWFLGAGSPNENSAARLPKVTRNADALVLEFDCLNAGDRGSAVFEVQYGQLDDWSETIIPGVPGTHTDGVVDYVITDPGEPGGLLKVVATIPAGEAAAGKLFGRFRGVK